MTDRYPEDEALVLPEHDALLFSLDRDHAETVLAADAVTRTIDVLERAQRRQGAEAVPRWALVTRAETLRAPDRAGALLADGMSPEGARRMAERIAPVLADGAIDTLAPDDWVVVASAHGVPPAERTVLMMLGALAVDAACALCHRHDDGVLETVVFVETVEGNPDGPWAGIVAAPLETRELFDTEVRSVVSDLRARIVRHYSGVRDWLPPGADTSVAVRCPEHHLGLPLVFSPFVVEDTHTRRHIGTGVPDAVLDTGLLRDHPPHAH